MAFVLCSVAWWKFFNLDCDTDASGKVNACNWMLDDALMGANATLVCSFIAGRSLEESFLRNFAKNSFKK